MSAVAKSIWWFEPAWSYCPRLKRELAVLRPIGIWLRIATAAVLLTALLAFAVKRSVPDLEFNWGKALAACLGILGLAMGLFLAVLWLIPPVIQVTRKGISRQQGQSIHWRLRGEIRRIIVDKTAPANPVLRVETCLNTWEAGIGPRIRPAELVTFLKQTFPELLTEEKS